PAVFPNHPRSRRTPSGDRCPNRAGDGASMRAYSGAALAAATILSACAVGPKYAPDVVVSPNERIGASRMTDSARRFFDSLATARRRDTAFVIRRPMVYQVASRDSIEAIAWLDILRDSALVRLVDFGLRQNRNLRLAEARINEFRASAGVARAPLLPSVTINGAESTNQIALGAFPPTSYRAARLTSDLAWELDFWGRVR